jgi:two-component system, OmpR family, alkaline phosphatase synthesis response regulator PhoP
MPKRVLVIDDDVDFVEAVTTLLDAKGYDAVSAPNGEEGLRLAEKQRPDVILLDVMMTRQTEGFDVAQHLNSSDSLKTVPVIMITGIRKEMSLPFGFQPDEKWLPVTVVLEKPVKPEVLLESIEEALRR